MWVPIGKSSQEVGPWCCTVETLQDVGPYREVLTGGGSLVLYSGNLTGCGSHSHIGKSSQEVGP